METTFLIIGGVGILVLALSVLIGDLFHFGHPDAAGPFSLPAVAGFIEESAQPHPRCQATDACRDLPRRESRQPLFGRQLDGARDGNAHDTGAAILPFIALQRRGFLALERGQRGLRCDLQRRLVPRQRARR